ncbi:LAETG motif-containing sortase-dependent surface protein [Streptomyces griseus]|uniref:LAETG motif-containing sortase-dependent surface protein n=1 Tax=Streptomyces TaxID=1883 RepID=UPI0001C1A032|nr:MULTISPECIES: LAETG motif-containing sortase-dependent surface protein [Streptomyces]EGE39827.1 LPXTG-motif cell wall anchor domain protein [Streptomyces sp. ACT-1]SBU98212.1 LPXTG-motif cell wall anchor domain-containing protein [Streptomyces sp. MnatMP-M77]SCE04100.1 LPXTG-motif cell wall anchor domain-containing protein [Streptomyces sp. OspMP-M43]SED79762.1 LPXTG-motif cell wall anchor domain-containing protein [Streptomyces griseus]SQA21056.1 LPXTG-motif cell wall anchor domain protein
MTIPRRSWRGAGALVAAAVVGLTGGVISAGPAAAHTPTWAVTCSEVTVDLTNYTSDVPNTVTITVDGQDLLPTETFGREFHKKLTLPEHDEPVTVRLVVKDADGDGKHSVDDEKTADVCDEEPSPTPTPTESVPGEPTPSETPSTGTPEPSATPSGQPSESAPAVPAPSPSSPDLAETGSSSSTPIIGGAAVAVLLAGGGILWAVRKRRTAQN